MQNFIRRNSKTSSIHGWRCLVGTEAAVSFAREGKTCAVIEMRDQVAADANSFYRGGLMPEVEKSAEIYTNTMVKEVTENGVLCERGGEELLIEADSVVCALLVIAPSTIR